MIRENESTQFLVIAGVGLFLGVVADIFFFQSPLGANVLLFVICFLVSLMGLITIFEKRVTISNTVLFVPALFFATMVAWVASPMLTLFNILLLVACLFATIISLTEQGFLGGSLQNFVKNASTAVLLDWIASPIVVLRESGIALQDIVVSQEENIQRSSGTIRSVVRGILFSLPILAISGFLLRSADAVFGKLLEKIVAWFPSATPIELFLQMCLIAAFTWMCVAAFKIVVRGVGYGDKEEEAEDDDDGYYIDVDFKPKGLPNFPVLRLGIIESSIVLGNLAVMFGIFVVIQLVYLFGGEGNTSNLGISYSDYAQRGFSELIVLGVMVLGLIMTLDFSTIRVSEQQRRVFSGLSIGIILMVLIILGSAFQRLQLFQDAAGFTRWYVTLHVFIVWIGLLFLFLLVDLLEMYPRLIWFGAGIMVIGVFVTLNLLNLDAYTAAKNVERFQEDQTKTVNMDYLSELSDDAVPAMVELYQSLPADHGDKLDLRLELRRRLRSLDEEKDGWGIFGYNRSKQRAWDMLDEIRSELETNPLP